MTFHPDWNLSWFFLHELLQSFTTNHETCVVYLFRLCMMHCNATYQHHKTFCTPAAFSLLFLAFTSSISSHDIIFHNACCIFRFYCLFVYSSYYNNISLRSIKEKEEKNKTLESKNNHTRLLIMLTSSTFHAKYLLFFPPVKIQTAPYAYCFRSMGSALTYLFLFLMT